MEADPPSLSGAATVDSIDRDSVAVKRTLVRVCKLWHELARDLLFEDITISRDALALRRALHARGDQKYKRIQRACIPYYSCTPYTSNDLQTVADMLHACPDLEILARPKSSHAEVMTFDFPAADCPTLPSLKRLDWWHYNEAARSGGVNALTDVIRAAPNLRYLSIGGDLWLNLMQRGSLTLPSLTTLRIRRMNVLVATSGCLNSYVGLRGIKGICALFR